MRESPSKLAFSVVCSKTQDSRARSSWNYCRKLRAQSARRGGTWVARPNVAASDAPRAEQVAEHQPEGDAGDEGVEHPQSAGGGLLALDVLGEEPHGCRCAAPRQ